jgi:formylglycine-generating enzyme required for sulfatase activity
LEQCWNGQLCVAKLVAVPPGLSIDATEVTRAQYTAWLDTLPSTAQQTPACAGNTDYQPGATCMALASVCKGSECGNHPQVCIDLCDAVAYCAAVGKHLCGGIGGSVLGSSQAMNDAKQSEWFNVCSSGGVNDYTHGSSYSGYLATAPCNDYFAGKTTTVPVGSMIRCQSPDPGYAGVFDMTGNVWEWEDNCAMSLGGTESCHPRGYPFGQGAAAPMCRQSTSVVRSAQSATIGFRCCNG